MGGGSCEAQENSGERQPSMLFYPSKFYDPHGKGSSKVF